MQEIVLTSTKATKMAPTMTKAELRTAHKMSERDRPPTAVNFSMSCNEGRRGQRSRNIIRM